MKREFKTIDEQIEILKHKGLKFKNEDMAKQILLRENYYYLTEEYEDVFMDLKKSTGKQDVYMPETYFEELYAIYTVPENTKSIAVSAFCYARLNGIILPDGIDVIGIGGEDNKQNGNKQ